MLLQLPHQRTLSLDRPRIMGILNVTPDSFSDGGRYGTLEAAVDQALRMIAEGADVIDVGGESTRPGAGRVEVQEQIRRTRDVVEAVVRASGEMFGQPAAVSIDTTQAAVAQAALDAGAGIINDISAGREDPGLLELAAAHQVPLILMHMQGTPGTMQQAPTYQDVVGEIEAFLLQRAKAAEAAGVPRSQIMIDPGIGFGKTREHNLTLLAHLGRFVATGYPVLLGTSRKRFMGSICHGPPAREEGKLVPQKATPTDLIGATCATTAAGVQAGAVMFRVHDVLPNRQAADVAWHIRQQR